MRSPLNGHVTAKAGDAKTSALFYSVEFHGCAVGLKDADGSPIKKPWRLMTNSKRLADSFACKQCPHDADAKHTHAAGSVASRTAFYPEQMCHLIIRALYPEAAAIPAPALLLFRKQRRRSSRLSRGHRCSCRVRS